MEEEHAQDEEAPVQPSEPDRNMRLFSRNLSRVPEMVIKTGDLKLIDLRFNKLTVLPSTLTLGSEKTLESLFLSNNLLMALPNELCRCRILSDLRVANNHIPLLPAAIGIIDTLVTLDASVNRIETLPETLSSLQNLRELNLSKNRLRDVPDDHLMFLTNLTDLSLASNQLETLPLATANLRKLRFLRASANRITSLHKDVVRLPKLTELHLADNLLVSLPDKCWKRATNLNTLDLCGNRLVQVPHQLGACTGLTILGLTRNAELPPTIAEAAYGGARAVLQTLRALGGLDQVPARAAGPRESEEGIGVMSEGEENESMLLVDAERRRRREERKKQMNAIVRGHNTGVNDFYQAMLSMSIEGAEEAEDDVQETKDRLVKRMLMTKPSIA